MNRRTFFRDALAAAAAAWGAPLVATGEPRFVPYGKSVTSADVNPPEYTAELLSNLGRCYHSEPSETVYVGDAHIFELDWSRATVRPIEATQ